MSRYEQRRQRRLQNASVRAGYREMESSEEFWVSKNLLTDEIRREVEEILKTPKRTGRVWK